MKRNQNIANELNAILCESMSGGLKSPLTIDRLLYGVDLASRLHRVADGVVLNLQIIEKALRSRRPDIASAAFLRSLHEYKHNRAEYPDIDIFTGYEWIICELSEYDTISRELILGIIDDFERQLTADTGSPRRAIVIAMAAGSFLGDIEMAKAAHARLRQDRSEIAADEPCFTALHYSFVCDHEQFFKAARYAWKPPTEKTATDVAVVCSESLVPLLLAGDRAQAARCYELSCEAVQITEIKSQAISAAQYLRLIGDNAAAVQTLLKQEHFFVNHASPHDVMDFSAQARFHPELAMIDYRAEAMRLAAAFDARNGNDYFTRELDCAESLNETMRTS